MATVFVIHDPADAGFVAGTVLKPLPGLGFDRSVSASEERDDVLAAMARCQASIVVVSAAARQSAGVRSLAMRVVPNPHATLAVLRDSTTAAQIAADLDAVPTLGREAT